MDFCLCKLNQSPRHNVLTRWERTNIILVILLVKRNRYVIELRHISARMAMTCCFPARYRLLLNPGKPDCSCLGPRHQAHHSTTASPPTPIFDRLKPVSQLRFDYDATTIRRYYDAFDYDGSDRNYDLRSIRLRYDYRQPATGISGWGHSSATWWGGTLLNRPIRNILKHHSPSGATIGYVCLGSPICSDIIIHCTFSSCN